MNDQEVYGKVEVGQSDKTQSVKRERIILKLNLEIRVLYLNHHQIFYLRAVAANK